MNTVRRIATGLALIALVSGAVAQDDPFTQLKMYDFQNRKPLDAISKMIQQSLLDRTRIAEMEKQLMAVLEDSSATFAGKQEACRFLWIIGTSVSVPALEKMLPDEKLGDLARYALERNPDPAAGRALRAALATATGRALIGIINSIGERRDPDAVKALRTLAMNPDKEVSGAAVVALGKIGTSTALAALQSLPTRDEAILKAMLRCLEGMVAAGKRAEAERVYVSLAANGRPAVPRSEAIRALAAMSSPRAVTAALEGLKSDDAYVQTVAARVCGQLTHPNVMRQCLALWPALSAPVQGVLLAAWGDRRAAAAMPVALNATASEDPTLRRTAIRTAALCGGAKAVGRLAEMAAKGPDQEAARDALAGLPGAEAEQALLQAAWQGAPEVRAAMMSVLAERPNAAAMALLREAARDTEPQVAIEALRALGRVGGPEVHGELVGALVAAQDEGVRDAAREAVVAIAQRVGDRDRAVEPVLAALSGASTAGRCALLPVLAEIGGERALGELTRAAGESDEEVKRAAIAALAETWGDSRAVPTLMGIAKNDASKSIRIQALRGSLRLIGLDNRISAEEKVARLNEAMALAERPEEKRLILSVLRDCRVLPAIELAARLLDDAELFPEAAETVLYLAAPQKKDNRNLPAVQGPAVTAALDKIIQMTKDENQRTQAQKLK